jgi:hypothetical protein
MAPVIALMALAALGLSSYPVHEPVHARWPDAGLTSGHDARVARRHQPGRRNR